MSATIKTESLSLDIAASRLRAALLQRALTADTARENADTWRALARNSAARNRRIMAHRTTNQEAE